MKTKPYLYKMIKLSILELLMDVKGKIIVYLYQPFLTSFSLLVDVD